MSRIVVLIGSVRKGGNTDLLASSFVRGAKENNEVSVFSVADCRVNPCIGCNTCFTREGNQCFQDDDMPPIYRALQEADMLVIASPVYFYGISAQLKAIIDRLHTPMKKSFHIRKLALLLVAADTKPDLFDAILTQFRLIRRYQHWEDAGAVLVRGAREMGTVPEEALQEAYSLGASLA